MQDIVDPVTDEMLAQFVVDSHYKSQAKGANLDKSISNSQDEFPDSAMPVDPEVLTQLVQITSDLLNFLWNSLVFLLFYQILSQDMLKKYITYAKLNVFPKLHDADLDKLTHVYAELRRESSVRFL